MTEIQSITELKEESHNALFRRASSNQGIDGLSTGYHDLDKVLLGLRPGTLITVGGRESMGKSAFVQNLLHNVSIEDGIPSLLFSAEMDSGQIVNRLIAMHCHVPCTNILSGQLTREEWARYDENIGSLEKKPLYIESTHLLYIEDIIRVAKEAVEKKGVKLIAIDDLHQVFYKDNLNDSRYIEVNGTIIRLKALAMELQVPIILISQLNRKGDERPGEYGQRPQLGDLRDAGSISFNSDIIMFVHRPEYFGIKEDANGNSLKGMALIIIAKNRFGPTADVTLSFKKEKLLFSNPDDDPLSGGMISEDVPY